MTGSLHRTADRTRLRVAGIIAVIAASSVGSFARAEEDALDPATGLIVAPGWELVAAHCGACHSHALVTAQRGDAEFWLSTIRWMQKTQNLWAIPEPQEQTLIDYLATHYNETDWGRRPPLPASLMPLESAD